MGSFGLGGIGRSFITILGAGLAVTALAADGDRSLADTESRLDQAASSGGSTIALSRTVTSQRSIIQNYESQISRLEAQKSQLQ